MEEPIWTNLLQGVLPRPCFERPFVCEGFPSDSVAIVIGENPATPMSSDWWSYWNEDVGFNYRKFVKDYLIDRQELGKRISNTRRRLDRIRESGIKVVETNAYRNEKLDGLGDETSNYDLLNLLISNMPRLKAVIAHGKHAGAFLGAVSFPEGVKTYKTRHFRSESYAVLDSICESIAS